MTGPDGLEQRTAWEDERAQDELDRIEKLEKREEEQVDEALLDMAQARMLSWAVDRVLT